MSRLPTIHERARDVILALAIIAVVSTGVPLIEVHTHHQPSLGHSHEPHVHSHDAHAHSHDVPGMPGNVEADDTNTAEAEDLHAHIVGSVAVALTSATDIDIQIPAYGRSRIPPPVIQPPDKPSPPLYRPPIA